MKNTHIFYLALLAVLSYFFFFSGLGNYGLIDIDETRYINIARNMLQNNNYITPYLNFEPFLEKPPLFYWLVVLSYKFFGQITDFTSRFFTAFLGCAGVFATYFFVFNIIKSKSAAFLSSVILASSFWYALFAHIAILDLGFCVFTTLSIYCAVSTLFCKNAIIKMLLWYFAYILAGLCVLQKGLIGIIIPVMSIFLIFLTLRRLKEIFKPSYIFPGVVLFLIVVVPWHYFVFKQNGVVWFNEYIIKHHFARFFNSSMDIGRKQSFWFYIPIILGGFMPWTFFLIATGVKGLKYALNSYKAVKSFLPLVVCNTNDRALLLINLVWFLGIFIFFSVSSTKLPTYILPAFAPLAILCGYFFWGYLNDGENKKYIEISSFITFLIFLSAGIFGLWFYFSGRINIGFYLALSFVLLSVLGVIFLIKQKKLAVFFLIAAFSFMLFGIFQAEVFNYVTGFGQGELIEYSKIASKDEQGELITLGFSNKYSMLFDYDKKPVYFIANTNSKYEAFKKLLRKFENKTVYLVIKNKIEYQSEYLKNFELIQKGIKYSLLKSK